MTDIEQKALDLVNAFRAERGWTTHTNFSRYDETMAEAICHAIEQHEAFRQEVSDAVFAYYGSYHNASGEPLERFIIGKPKFDPLVEVMDDLGWDSDVATDYAKDLRAALEARGLEIREKGQ